MSFPYISLLVYVEDLPPSFLSIIPSSNLIFRTTLGGLYWSFLIACLVFAGLLSAGKFKMGLLSAYQLPTQNSPKSMVEIGAARDFIEGIGLRDAERVTNHINPEKYIEHNPRVADGLAGLQAYVETLPEENHTLQLVRAFQDGSFVFTQSHGSVLGQYEFFDVFGFEDGLIVEHWIFSAPGSPPNKDGHTQVDGPIKPNDLANSDESKKLVRDYYETVHIARQDDKIPHYFDGDYCVRHEPGVADGVAAFMSDLKMLTQSRSIDEIALLLAHGDFVFVVGKGTHKSNACLYVDLYRVENHKLVEHWGFPQEVPPQQEWKNSNGMV